MHAGQETIITRQETLRTKHKERKTLRETKPEPQRINTRIRKLINLRKLN